MLSDHRDILNKWKWANPEQYLAAAKAAQAGVKAKRAKKL
jgi:hypothetical protein